MTKLGSNEQTLALQWDFGPNEASLEPAPMPGEIEGKIGQDLTGRLVVVVPIAVGVTNVACGK